MTEEIQKTKPIGRTLRLLGGVALLIIDLPVLLRQYSVQFLGIAEIGLKWPVPRKPHS